MRRRGAFQRSFWDRHRDLYFLPDLVEEVAQSQERVRSLDRLLFVLDTDSDQPPILAPDREESVKKAPGFGDHIPMGSRYPWRTAILFFPSTGIIIRPTDRTNSFL